MSRSAQGRVVVEDRRRMALAMRRLASRRITVSEFEEIADEMDIADEAVQSAYAYVWRHYDDFETVRLEGRWALSSRSRRIWAAWILYLSTDSDPYPWRAVGIGLDLSHLVWLASMYAWSLVTWRQGIERWALSTFAVGFLVHWVFIKATCRRSQREYTETGIGSLYWPFTDRLALNEASSKYLLQVFG